jgi:hypothetical protein
MGIILPRKKKCAYYCASRQPIRPWVYCLPRPRVTPEPRAIPLTGLRVVVVDDFVPDVVEVVLDPLVLVPE